MVNLVIVSHSAQLGQGVGELARQMLRDDRCKLAIAAGIDDPTNPIGTDPIKVMEAILSVADADAILVLMDIGSALLSAETALDLLDADIAARVHLCPAPLVEGALAATVSAASGASIDKVIEDAQSALQAKRIQLGFPLYEERQNADSLEVSDESDAQAQSVTVEINNPNGLHVRPAARLIAGLSGFDAALLLEKEGKCVKPDSINQIALLKVRCHDRVRLIAKGSQAAEALAAFQALAADNFGERGHTETLPESAHASRTKASGQVLHYRPVHYSFDDIPEGTQDNECRRLKIAVSHTLDDLISLTHLAAEKYTDDIAAIFSGQHTLLDDPELLKSVGERLRQQKCSAERAWQQTMMALSQQYRELDDDYLQARYIDVEDIMHRTLGHLTDTPDNVPCLHHRTILIADDIYPSVVLQLDAGNAAAICLRHGSPLAHGAIIAREAGIPWLCQQGDAFDAPHDGDLLTLDRLDTRQ
ncbi:dihydroxyacetone kinase phosphoryl donor subunit DhaM [Pseudocitrobacter cyperus]|uniref:phosphoenolpyruvate--glycerone phosphotransferase n=1 Tax=Pseudocitrobacter cyperus TaxID=3112843 RepID=A0ABV0HGM1_9ENTR